MTQYATGGFVHGPTSDPDLIPVWLDTRETVIFLDGTVRCIHAQQDATAEKRTPEEWCQHYGMEVLDGDGWADGTPWIEPLTLEDFAARAAQSTIRFPHNLRSTQYG